MSDTIYLVVGASRGIGQALVENLSQSSSNKVIAATRKPKDFGKPNVENVIIDQTSEDSVAAAASKIKEIDTVIVNAAIGAEDRLVDTSTERFREYLETNVIGVHRIVNALLPALKARKTKQIIIISSYSGSNKHQVNNHFAFQGPYSVTKAANNMQAVQWHNELHDDGFTIIPLHPGWVATDMGNSVSGMDKVDNKPISVAESASGIINVIKNLKPEDSATFFSYDGSHVPW